MPLPTCEEENFEVNVHRIEPLITEKTKAILFNTPNNPTGCCFDREALEVIADVAKRHDLLVIADDIYTIFSYAGPFIPIGTLPGMAERTVTVRSFSKDYCMTGWRLGYVIAPAADYRGELPWLGRAMCTRPPASPVGGDCSALPAP